MNAPFSTLEPGDLIEVPAGYVVAPVRHPLVTWDVRDNTHSAFLGEHLIAIVHDAGEGRDWYFSMHICGPKDRPVHRSAHGQFRADTLKRAKHMVETMVEKWVTAAGLMAGQTVYYTKPTDDEVSE
jgi:hypothetical protein